jgi:signal transduction histidine kinase/phage shock protein PspC (stress-responsive transcriptional regulator)
MSTTIDTNGEARPERHQIMSGRITRSTSDRFVAGLAGGIAARLGIPSPYVRAAFATLTLAGGFGVLCYVVGWIVTPDEAQYGSMIEAEHPPTSGRRLGLGLGFVGGLVFLEAAGLWFGSVVWPSALFFFGAALVWDRSSRERRERLAQFAKPPDDGERRSRSQVFVGAALMGVGVVVVLASLESFQSLGPVAIAILLTATGFMLLFGPWIYGLFADLGEERRARIRSEERADMAAHLHDSVLQTLAMIQRTDDPQRMVTLARAQERDLRTWLYEPEADAGDGSVAEEFQAAASKVESDFDVPIDVVVVGDRAIADHERPIVAAAAEAMANAAQHSGASSVSVYVECSDGVVDAWISDQGSGFDESAVPDDRKGIAESIRARVRRAGGEARIDATPGVGTEVHLRSEPR